MYFHYGLKLASLDVNKRFRSCATLLPHYFLNKSSKEKGQQKNPPFEAIFVSFQRASFFPALLSHPQGYIRSEDTDSEKKKKELKSDMGSVLKLLWMERERSCCRVNSFV